MNEFAWFICLKLVLLFAVHLHLSATVEEVYVTLAAYKLDSRIKEKINFSNTKSFGNPTDLNQEKFNLM